eukprot:2031309-Pyramimonas_sp.AAC.1
MGHHGEILALQSSLEAQAHHVHQRIIGAAASGVESHLIKDAELRRLDFTIAGYLRAPTQGKATTQEDGCYMAMSIIEVFLRCRKFPICVEIRVRRA